jgi:hypothetical protein
MHKIFLKNIFYPILAFLLLFWLFLEAWGTHHPPVELFHFFSTIGEGLPQLAYIQAETTGR